MHLTGTDNKLIEFYTATYESSASNWVTWYKPSNVKQVSFVLCGGGGGGGRVADGNSGNGGKGGSSGVMITAIIPALLLPNTLYIKPGYGGLGATVANTTGSDGQSTLLALEPNNSYYIFSATGGSGGGSGSSGGSASASQSVFYGYSLQFIYQTIPSIGASNGATSTNGSGSSLGFLGSSAIVFGGSGGGNGTGNGGGQTGNGFHGFLSGGANSGGNGNKGLNNFQTILNSSIETYSSGYYSTGGTGGGGNTTGVAGRGGDGSFGSGGGGGGGCNNAAGTSGNGGNGGNGFVMIIAC